MNVKEAATLLSYVVATMPNIQDKDYIFCYFLGDNKMAREMAIAMKKKTGKKPVF